MPAAVAYPRLRPIKFDDADAHVVRVINATPVAMVKITISSESSVVVGAPDAARRSSPVRPARVKPAPRHSVVVTRRPTTAADKGRARTSVSAPRG
jgi:hypothetical protein